MRFCPEHYSSWATCDLKSKKCEKCGKLFFSPSCPSYIICNDCSQKENLCVICGKKIERK